MKFAPIPPKPKTKLPNRESRAFPVLAFKSIKSIKFKSTLVHVALTQKFHSLKNENEIWREKHD